MATVQSGDTVQVHYTGKLSDGTVFDSSRERDPLSFTVGQQQVIPGFEETVLGMAEGETVERTLASAQAYGSRRDDLIMDFERTNFPEDLEPQVGMHFELRTQDGRPVPAQVVAVNPESVTLDANHPLAGQDLTFEIEVVKIG